MLALRQLFFFAEPRALLLCELFKAYLEFGLFALVLQLLFAHFFDVAV